MGKFEESAVATKKKSKGLRCKSQPAESVDDRLYYCAAMLNVWGVIGNDQLSLIRSKILLNALKRVAKGEEGNDEQV